MIRADRMMLDEMHVDHLRLILGTSMGCMQGFVWGETYPEFMDALAPFACLPVEIAGRNRMMRYMAIQDLKLDPAKKPREMDITYDDGPNKGKTHHAIYALEGDTLTICRHQQPGRERPNSRARAGSQARPDLLVESGVLGTRGTQHHDRDPRYGCYYRACLCTAAFSELGREPA